MFSIRFRALAVKKKNNRPILQHPTNTNETKEPYCRNMCKHMEHLETYKYETLWNHVKRGTQYGKWKLSLLSVLTTKTIVLPLYPVRKHGWVMSGDHPFAMIAPPGRRGVFSQHRCMSLKFFVLTIGASFRSGWKIIASVAVARAHTRVFKPSHVSPWIYWASHLLVVDFFLEHLLPAVRFLSSPFGPVSWDVQCLLNPSQSFVIFKFLRWSYALPIFLKFLRRHDGKGPLKPVILNHILQRAKHRWSSIFWDRNLRIRSRLRFFATQFFEVWRWGATLVTWTFEDSPKENSCVEKRPKVSMTINWDVRNSRTSKDDP